MKYQVAHNLSENGLVPDRLIRHGIRRLLQQRLAEVGVNDIERVARNQQTLIQHMHEASIAELPTKANEQHYELPAKFFQQILGQRLKYSCAYWPDDATSLNAAESAALAITCERAELNDNMRILELGCGWGSLSLWMAEHFPNSHITAVSNSHSQGAFILERAREMKLENIKVVSADMNNYMPRGLFDRVVSVEMFEHMRSWSKLLRNISRWLEPSGKFFMHIFVHRTTPYLFEEHDSSDWMSRHFFAGGMMPSTDLPLQFQDDLRLEQRWNWHGLHYERTCNAWLSNMDRNKRNIWPILEQTYGKDFAKIWWMRWRMFFMACAELFAYNTGQEWFVSHYRFSNYRSART